MGKAFYRKYRSTAFSEVVGQDPITKTLQSAIAQGKISHAYLFTGPRGTGKTSVARILAHAVNEISYSATPHLDIIEIDAASNRRIDEIRDLREKVHIAPTSAKYKVYIIDEVHMLTKEAFNALLKTLEEPPEHVIFILATTDAHKLPATIISRTQRYVFRPASPENVVNHLKSIAKKENITVDDDALQLLADHGEGSFRDSVNLLDQLGSSSTSVTADAVREQLGVPPAEAIHDITQKLLQSELALALLHDLYQQGYHAPDIAKQIASEVRADIIAQAGDDRAVTLLKDLLEVESSHSPERKLEVIILSCAVRSKPVKDAANINSAVQPPQPTAGKQHDEPNVKEKPKTAPAKIKAEPENSIVATSDTVTSEQWANVLDALKKQYNTIYGIVRMGQTDFSQPGKVVIKFGFAFHNKRMQDAKNKRIVTDIITQVTGQPFILQTSHEPNAQPGKSPIQPNNENALQDVSSVFGGGELI